MRASSAMLPILPLLVGYVAAQKVVGTAMGFAEGATGGGDAAPAIPADIEELKLWLGDDEPRVIVLDKEYNFIGSEGKVTEMGCRPPNNKCPGNGGQDAINGANWCADKPEIEVTYDKAGIKGIDVASHKTILGIGSEGVLRGKGLRMVKGVENVIIQNIHITELNPQYIWGGDAIQTFGAAKIWVDHVKISLIGRQMFAASSGGSTGGSVTISNSEFDGLTSWSSRCNNKHYWTILLNGEQDSITLFGNYIHDTAGRSPKVAGKATVLHAVNNLFEEVDEGFDVTAPSEVLAEGNTLDRVEEPILEDKKTGKLYTQDGAACDPIFGRDCLANTVSDSGSFESKDQVFDAFKGCPAVEPDNSINPRVTAGVGKLGCGGGGY
ncbi:uncharacterized protein L3040_000044 [Drepanopeziza brunnea f. sp. 'multigermtubi']|uniref:pectin lyase n=1 Tax=Marssonina brunnea f. sp. multigermtubi (strain MB_m1) TaxID=1072389 RepID=K1X0Y9_MARBU|nr:pectin lyase A precursor [Drepanopeziza brunnea f. sp. 'multigermtubi' MB_m1]EKD14523.1 pectin lyase A precursor [Drepanopeziza brunnea f. sp. 'multigermtubi' MB_m1]KAJ5053753.1 hypothetical protein L3040_000044 [Drepanopeziza brunnea f. sp. 'multigermtubi']